MYGEASTYAPGDEIVTTTLEPGTTAGLSICFDLRYPELYRILALRGARAADGAERVHAAHDP